jgi:hypothetical protein
LRQDVNQPLKRFGLLVIVSAPGNAELLEEIIRGAAVEVLAGEDEVGPPPLIARIGRAFTWLEAVEGR